jgi:uncharacterized protein with GYD domain
MNSTLHTPLFGAPRAPLSLRDGNFTGVGQIPASRMVGIQPVTIGSESGRAGGPGTEVTAMAKYMIEASYTIDGVKGLVKEGGSGRRAAIEKAVQGLGGSVECFYFVFGEDDVVVIVDLPDNGSVAALSLGISAAGGASCSVRVLLTPEEIDGAVKKTVGYRAPGD